MSNSIDLLAKTDIYLIDQLLKGRFLPNQSIADIGCGMGRNLPYFLHQKHSVFGIDVNPEAIEVCTELAHYFKANAQFKLGSGMQIEAESNTFDWVLSSAVLHFSNSLEDFQTQFAELVRILKPGGTLFIRLASSIGIENLIQKTANPWQWLLPDESTRFLVNEELIHEIVQHHMLTFIEPIKTTNVQNLRCMTTLVLQKN